ncbi:MAG: nucleotide exchange factor GrpE [Victivallaceae bacterium]|nr:nucleotide exchange factor GrpE [Victivallaceae bacterium]
MSDNTSKPVYIYKHPIYSGPRKNEVPPENNESGWREEMVDKFKEYLYTLTDEEFDEQADFSDEVPDMFSFYSELTALKQEISLQSKSAKKSGSDMLKSMSGLHEDLVRQSSTLSKTVTDIKGQIPLARQQAEETVLLELINLRESITNNLKHFKGRKLHGIFWRKKVTDLFHEQQSNLELLLKKADDILRRFDVTSIVTEGAPFNSSSMRVLSVSNKGLYPPGSVSKIFSQGFKRNSRILITAEVKVEKHHE